MAARAQDASDYYVWEAPGKPAVIHLHLDVLDRIASEVMRGFGAVPKRGAEVGGVLIGTIEAGESGDPATARPMVRIDDFEPVECDYKRGPSYLFTEDDKAVFEDAVKRWQRDPERPAYAVGFYRSHTREGMSLAPEDIGLLDEFFPVAENVVLLIKPYGTRVSEAGFFAREDGVFPETSPLEFPFRRYELTGEEPPPRRSLTEPRQRGTASRPRGRALRPLPMAGPGADDDVDQGEGVYDDGHHGTHHDAHHDTAATPVRRPAHLRGSAAEGAYAVKQPARSRSGSGVWIPLSFVFLVFGLAIGMMISLARAPKAAGSDADYFTLGLTVSKSGESLSVKWDPQAPAVRGAQQGTIEIQDGANAAKPYDLDAAQLKNGGMVYTSSSNAVKFTLIVYPRSRLSVAETVEWRP